MKKYLVLFTMVAALGLVCGYELYYEELTALAIFGGLYLSF